MYAVCALVSLIIKIKTKTDNNKYCFYGNYGHRFLYCFQHQNCIVEIYDLNLKIQNYFI